MTRTIKTSLSLFLVSVLLALSCAAPAFACAPIGLDDENGGPAVSFNVEASNLFTMDMTFETSDGHTYQIKLITDQMVTLANLETLKAAVYRDGQYILTLDFMQLYRILSGLEANDGTAADFDSSLHGDAFNDAEDAEGFEELGV